MKCILFQSLFYAARSIKWPETQFFPLPLNFNPFVSETRKKSSISGFLIDGQKIFHWEGSFQYRTNWSMQKKIGHNGNSIEKSLHDFIRAFNWSTSSVAPEATKKLRDRHVKILWQIIGEEKRKFGKSRFPKKCCDLFVRTTTSVLSRLAEIVLSTFFSVFQVVVSSFSAKQSFHCSFFFPGWFSVDRVRLCSFSGSFVFCSLQLLSLSDYSDESSTWIWALLLLTQNQPFLYFLDDWGLDCNQ